MPLLALLACSDSTVIGKFANSDPAVEIAAPADDYEAVPGEAIEVVALYADHESERADLSRSWLLDG